MRSLLCPILAAALAGCVRFDPADAARLRDAMHAGGVALSTINKCLIHMDRSSNTSAPECNAGDQMSAYQEAKQRLRAPARPTLQAMDQRIEDARMEAIGALVRIAEQSALNCTGKAC